MALDGAAAAATAMAIDPAMTVAGVATPPPTPDPNATWAMAPAPLAAPSLDLQPGSAFGARYRIEKLLGQGGMGAVYKAYDIEIGRTVALKLVRPELATSPETMRRFKQELALASRISHRNVLRIHDLGDVNGVKFITMAFVEGKDLAGVMEEGRLTIERSLVFAKQLCSALEAAHLEGVVHRDLKPQNVLIDQADNVYVSDFGLAKSLESEATMMTRTGQILGTPRYMSPEQVEAREVDHRSDLYSFGLILCEMLTDAIPFRGESTLQLMYQRVNQEPQDPRTMRPDLPDYVALIVLKCLAKDPAERYQNAREILNDLESGSAPMVSARREAAPTISIQIPRPSKRAPLVVGAAVAALLVAAGLIPGVRNAVLRRGAASGAQQGAQPVAVQKYVAVLPFRTAGAEDTLKYAAEGVVDSLAAKLSGLKTVYVASGSAVESARSLPTAQKIAQALGVTLLVQGSVQSAGDRLSIAVSLDDVKTGRRVWSEEFSGMRQDLLTIEDQIFTKLGNALEMKQSTEELARTTARPTEDIGAYELYLKSRNMMRGKQDVKNIDTALSLFDQAIKRDPSFALAYAGSAEASLMMFDLKKDSVWTQRALGAALQAARMNENLPEVHYSLGSVYTATGRTAEAIAELKRALELAPNSDDGLRRLGVAYLASQRTKEGIAAFQEAIRVNPYYWMNYNRLGGAYFQTGDYQKAMEAFRKISELEPDRAAGYANMGVVYFRQGKWNECIPVFQKAIQLQPQPLYYSNLGAAYFYQGRYAEAAQMFQKSVELRPNDPVARGNLGDAQRWSGQRDKAMADYDQAIALAYKSFQVNPRDAATLGNLGLYYAKRGDATKALDFIRRARAIDRADSALTYKEALVRAMAGQAPEAIATLREALQNGYSLEEAKSEPELKTLRERPEFGQMMQALNAKPK